MPNQTTDRLKTPLSLDARTSDVHIPQGIPITARKGQRVAQLTGDARKAAYIVRSGALLVTGSLFGDRRQVLSILYPGDAFWGLAAAPLPEMGLFAPVPAQLVRVKCASVQDAVADGLAGMLAERTARLLACAQLTATMIGQLSGEERTTGFFVEAGLRLGRRTPGGLVIDLPVGRTDIADYLSLNPDTLSRILSRLKAQGLIRSTGRSRYILPSWDDLKAHTPAADALVRLHQI